jgi:Alginate lyase
MIKNSILFSMLFVFLSIVAGFGITKLPAAADEASPVFVLDFKNLVEAKNRVKSGDPSALPASRKLLRDADHALDGGTFSVVDKELVPPGGDKHDYMSLGPYWWPNPNTANGLPYVLRDGEFNPERDNTSDRKTLDNMVQRVKTLALGYFFTDRDAYAAQAAKLLRVWFVDGATKMNPHLKYAQVIPGRNNVQGTGIIDTHNLPELIDSVALLTGSKAWSEKDRKDLQNWFDAYLAWLVESPEGRAEARAQNNHGSWYDVQVASYALFLERKDLATTVLKDFPAKRIAQQIEPDGRQSRELQRTQAWSYSLFNLQALFDAASLGDKLRLDLWNFKTQDGRSIRKALDWLIPFATGEKKWAYQQISGWQPEKLAPLIRQATLRLRDPSYTAALSKLSGRVPDGREYLLYPLAESYSLPK